MVYDDGVDRDMTRMQGHTAVFALFQNREDVESAVDTLKVNKFRNTDISVLMPSAEGTRNFAHEKATKAPEGIATGATSGLAIGGALGWLAGIGALAIPGIGPFVAAGPIVAAIAGAGIGGTVGGLAGGLIGLGIPEYEAKRYETALKAGGILMSVHVDDSAWASKAEKILKSCGGTDVSREAEMKVASMKKPMHKDVNVPHDTL